MSTTLSSHLLPALAAASVLLLAPSAPQDPPEDLPVEEPVELPEDDITEELARLLGNRDASEEEWSLPEEWQDLLGTWQLMDFNHIDAIIKPEEVGGYLHLGEGVLTMIIHARDSDLEGGSDPLGQAGIHRWRLVRGDILQTATMMGHSNMGDDFDWEQPNTPREFRAQLVSNQLILERPDGSRLTYARVRGFAFPLAAIEAIEGARAVPEGE